MGETALVVLVPEAEPVVAAKRLRHDPSAADGVPAHVTLLYPFRSEVDDISASKVAAIATRITSFDVAFARIGHFPDGVVYLAPSPSGPFHQLTEALMTSFPDCPPYSGTISNPVPHLTVADGVDATTATALEEALQPGVPVTARVKRVTLIGQDAADRWVIQRQWPLG